MNEETKNTVDIDEALYRPIYETGKSFYFAVGFLLFIIGFTLVVYIRQVYYGLGVTGMNQPVTWGFYIVNFVFFVGISHAGTLISAILRLSKAEWRRPITRMAEVITAIVLAIGGLHPIIDLGRPDRVLNIFTAGRLQSPLLWDVTSITAYFTASTVYLYLPMIPDIAKLRDRGGKMVWFYEFLSWGWHGTEHQKKVLSRAINILMVMVIPIAISVHTVISYIFSMTLQPGWHSTIFGPYFVVGAIFSGIAALMIVMISFRKYFHLENYLKLVHFRHLGTLLLIMSLLWFYFTFSEYLTGVFGAEPHEMDVIFYKFTGTYAIFFWGMVVCNFLIPVVILAFKKFKTIPGILIASISVVIGMWLERLNIVIPSLANPRMGLDMGMYIPSFTEWTLFIGGLAVFVLGFLVFSKFFPIISIWEIEEGRKESVKEVEKRVTSYLPDPANSVE
ncbi:MAG: polysulfide reductase [Ignavibacteria bacterium CG22_combo_CG10-13_8_21_14_all_37_15]|nr:MAG: polysulfide reductase [Ignavibacteria bacterium CG22_combo_CG10-13_8_21_14_all_37_15]PIS45991.1 MAG: polysulfide reductase [Ignavibacteria bacterium CG08_land_8_20_14_0_20_37_9]PJC59801.1 MAG: polysulfide reductase [Ignavibacteria bacterium CG_4_9_14_0_2_um_filter_37_13]